MFDVCTTGDTEHIDTIFKLLPNESTWVQRYSSLLQRSLALGHRGLVGWSFAYFARNARCTVSTDLLCDIPIHKTTSPPERPFSHYIHSHLLVAEMSTMMKRHLTGKKKVFSCSFCMYRFRKHLSYDFCNPGVHYETPCIPPGLTFRNVTFSPHCVFCVDLRINSYYFPIQY